MRLSNYSTIVYFALDVLFFFLMIRGPPKSTLDRSSAASELYKRRPCVSIVSTAIDSPQGRAVAQAAVDQIANQIWADRAQFVYHSEPLEQSLERAKTLSKNATRPVLLLDHGDNCMSGGTCDTMDVLQTALAHGLQDIVTGPLCDPQAVASLVQALSLIHISEPTRPY